MADLPVSFMPLAKVAGTSSPSVTVVDHGQAAVYDLIAWGVALWNRVATVSRSRSPPPFETLPNDTQRRVVVGRILVKVRAERQAKAG